MLLSEFGGSLMGLMLLKWLLLIQARPTQADEQDEVLMTERVEVHKVNCFKKGEAACVLWKQMLDGLNVVFL